MPNKFHNQGFGSAKGAPTGVRAPAKTDTPESTADWPGVPGSTQPKDRSNGVPKCKCTVKSEGV